jgi:uncharacterized protein YunC (DUF1805 family)
VLDVVVVDSVTDLTEASRDVVAVTGSHGGEFSGRAALAGRVRGAVFSDAGGGLDQAGVSGLAFLAEHGVPAAAVGAGSARIGDGDDVWRSGIVTARNTIAAALGVELGMTCRAAARRMTRNHAATGPAAGVPAESRTLVADGRVKVWALDSASLAAPQDDGTVLATGSHGGLPGGDPARALNCTPVLAAFNDAGVGKDDAGIGRLGPLDDRGVAAVTVSAASARIGDGVSTVEDGVISHVNVAAARLGATEGERLRDLVGRLSREGFNR